MKFPQRSALFLALLFLFSVLFPSRARAQTASSEPPPGVAVKRDIVYFKIGARALHLLLARPNPLPKSNLPVVIYLHGGAWRNGSHLNLTAGAWNLARRGYAVASVEFRGSDEAIFPAPLDDCRAAISWIKKNAAPYSLDTKRLGVYGVSTGGHLAALLALTSSSIGAAAIESAPTDLASLNQGARLDWNAPNSPLSKFLGGTLAQKSALARRASPLFYADETAPPFLILHGDADEFVPIAQSEKLYQKLKAAGTSVDFQVFAGEAHGLKGARAAADASVAKFFERALK